MRLIAARFREPESGEDAGALGVVAGAAIEPLQDDGIGVHDRGQLVVAGGLAHELLELARPRLQRGRVAGGESDRLADGLSGSRSGSWLRKPTACRAPG